MLFRRRRSYRSLHMNSRDQIISQRINTKPLKRTFHNCITDILYFLSQVLCFGIPAFENHSPTTLSTHNIIYRQRPNELCVLGSSNLGSQQNILPFSKLVFVQITPPRFNRDTLNNSDIEYSKPYVRINTFATRDNLNKMDPSYVICLVSIMISKVFFV
jgi:hypothetical protein